MVILSNIHKIQICLPQKLEFLELIRPSSIYYLYINLTKGTNYKEYIIVDYLKAKGSVSVINLGKRIV